MSLAETIRAASREGWQMARSQRGVSSVRLTDADGGELLTLTDADDWMPRPVTDGAGGGETTMELLIMSEGIDQEIRAAERFEMGGLIYERVGSASPPGFRLPYAWVIALKPVGRVS